MDPLLLVAEHRSWLWMVLVGIGVALNVLWIRFGPRLSTRLRAARLRARLGDGSPLETGTEGEEVTLVGTLRLSGEPTARFEGGGTAAATTASPARPSSVVGALAISRSGEGLALDVGGVDVGLGGDLEVLVGSTEVYPGQRFSRLGGSTEGQLFTVNDDALQAMSSYRAAFRSLQAGDAVRVRGYLCRQDSPAGADSYRSGGGRWALAPQPILDAEKAKGWPMAAAFEGTPSIALPGWARLARKLVAVTVLWTAGVAAAGIVFLMTDGVFLGRLRPAGRDLPGLCYAHPVTAMTYVGLVLPFARAEVEQSLSSTLDGRCLWRAEDLEQLVSFDRQAGRCEEVTQSLIEHGALSRGGAELDQCMPASASDDAIRLRFLLGRFDEVNELAPGGGGPWGYSPHCLLVAESHLLEGAPERAAPSLLRLASRRGYYGSGVLDQLPASHELDGFSLACLADGVTPEHQDPEARQRLQIHAQLGLGSTACPLIHAERLMAPERLALLRRVAEGSVSHSWEALMMIATVDPGAVEDLRPRFVGSSLGTLSVGPIGMAPRGDLYGALEDGALEALEPLEAPGQRTTVLRAELHARASQVELALGEIEAARRHARRVVVELEGIDAPNRPDRLRYQWYQNALGRQAAVELWDGEVAAADALIRRVRQTARREGDARDLLLRLEALRQFVADGETAGILANDVVRGFGQRAAWQAVERGNGEGIAAAMASRQPILDPETLPLWLRHLPEDGEVVHDQARWRNRHPGHSSSLWWALVTHAWDLQAARAFGDDEWAAEVEPVYQAFRRAYLDRHDIGLALRLIEGS